jgi:hypothetical protein
MSDKSLISCPQINTDDYPPKPQDILSCQSIYDLGIFKYSKEYHEEQYQRLREEAAKIFYGQDYERETVIDISFSEEPKPRNRTKNKNDKKIIIDYKTETTLYDDKCKYPSVFDNEFTVCVRTNLRIFYFPVHYRYRWNNADIWGFLQIIAMCSKDDRRVILGSGLHDYLLDYRQLLFTFIKAQHPDLTASEFRWLTSDIFGYTIESQGMPRVRAVAMKNTVDFFQKNAVGADWELT